MSIVLGQLSALPSDAFLGTDRCPALLADKITSFGRDINLDALADVIDECKRRFTELETGEAQTTPADQWLAPRVHAALRLTKREATNSEVWTYLAAYAFPDYVVWRWGRDRQLALSFTSDVKKHPFKRLWWGAEMFRNGEDYRGVELAYRRSDVPNTSLSTQVMNNRAVALAVLRYLDKHELGSRQVNPLSTQLRTAAITVALDSACPNYTEASELDWQWLQEQPFADDIIASPSGPKHGFVSEKEIRTAEDVLERVIDLERVRSYRRTKMEMAAT